MKQLHYSKFFYSYNLKKIGALTSKPYSFKGRPWELVKLEMIDFFDGLGSGIRVDTRGMDILRILPQISSNLNEDWITDKIRFGFDGLKYQRIFVPLKKVNNIFIKITWLEAFNLIKTWFIKGQTMFEGLAGAFTDIETLYAFKVFLAGSGSNLIKFNDKNLNMDLDFSNNFLVNMKISQILLYDLIILINCEPRLEAPLVNIKIRKQVLKGRCKVYFWGSNINTTFNVNNLGNSMQKLCLFLEGKHLLSPKFFRARTPFIFLGANLFQRKDSYSYTRLFTYFFNRFKNIFLGKNMNHVGILSPTSAFVGGCWLSDAKKLNYGKILNDKILYLVGADEVYVEKNKYKAIIYQGHHGDRGAKQADLILPVQGLFEKTGRYYNMEGVLHLSKYIFTLNKTMISDWKLFKLLSIHLDLNGVYFNNFYSDVNTIYPNKTISTLIYCKNNNPIFFYNTPWKKFIKNYYAEDVIARASPTLNLQVILYNTKNFNCY